MERAYQQRPSSPLCYPALLFRPPRLPAEGYALPERALRPPPDVLVGRYWLPVVAYLAIIQVLGMQQNLQVPMIIFNADKAVHTIEYGTLGFLLARAVRATLGGFEPLKTALLAWAVGVGVGALDETIQKFVPGRTSSVN